MTGFKIRFKILRKKQNFCFFRPFDFMTFYFLTGYGTNRYARVVLMAQKRIHNLTYLPSFQLTHHISHITTSRASTIEYSAPPLPASRSFRPLISPRAAEGHISGRTFDPVLNKRRIAAGSPRNRRAKYSRKAIGIPRTAGRNLHGGWHRAIQGSVPHTSQEH